MGVDGAFVQVTGYGQIHLGHMRHFFQMDIGGMPHSEVLASIELLGTEVAPRVRAEIGSDGAAPSS